MFPGCPFNGASAPAQAGVIAQAGINRIGIGKKAGMLKRRKISAVGEVVKAFD